MTILYRSGLILLACIAVVCVHAQTEQPCPKLELVGPAGILSTGDDAEFRVSAKDGTDISNAKVQWTVSEGIITKGQGTPTIMFSAANSVDGPLKVTARVNTISPTCNSLLSGEWGIANRTFDPIIDSFGREPRNYLLTRIDNIFAQLKFNPNFEAIFLMRFDADPPPAYKASWIKLFLQCMNYRKYDLTRVSFYFEPENGDERTNVIIILPDSKFEFDPSRLIKGEEIGSKLKDLFH